MTKLLKQIAAVIWLASLGAAIWYGKIVEDAPLLYQAVPLAVVVLGIVVVWKFVGTKDDGPDEYVRAAFPDSDAKDLYEAFEQLSGRASRAKELAGWALMLRVPWRDNYPAVSSWIGGAPRMPAEFDWPRDADSKPLHFLAQIDLAALEPEPQTGRRPPGLAQTGALLVFIGRGDNYEVRLIDADAMAQARECTPPKDIGSLEELGFFSADHAFCHWPVDPKPFLDRAGERPGLFGDWPAEPNGWITTWGLAEFEARLVLARMERVLNAPKSSARVPQQMIEHAPALRETLTGLVAEATNHDPASPVDASKLRNVFAARRSMAETLASNPLRGLLEGDAGETWKRLRMTQRDLRDFEDFVRLPEEFRPFAETMITDWRGHRLFGLEPPPGNNYENLDGLDSLIAIHSDPLLGTESEHEYGVAIWCPRSEMAKDRFDGGLLQWLCAV